MCHPVNAQAMDLLVPRCNARRRAWHLTKQDKQVVESKPQTDLAQEHVEIIAEDRRAANKKISTAIAAQSVSVWVAEQTLRQQQLQRLVGQAKQTCRQRAIAAQQRSFQLRFARAAPIGKCAVITRPCCTCSLCSRDRKLAAVQLIYNAHKASCVEVRLSTDGWNISHNLLWNSTEEVFAIECNLPIGEAVQFKFIVDGVWQTSNEYPTCCDPHNNINNVVVPVVFELRNETCLPQTDVALRSQHTNWNVAHKMQFCSTRKCHAVVCALPPASSNEFKFVVARQWCTASNYPTTSTSSGFTNNVLVTPQAL